MPNPDELKRLEDDFDTILEKSECCDAYIIVQFDWESDPKPIRRCLRCWELA